VYREGVLGGGIGRVYREGVRQAPAVENSYDLILAIKGSQVLWHFSAHSLNYGACVGLVSTMYVYGVYTVFLAGNSPNIRAYTVYIYGSGQPYLYIGLAKTIYIRCIHGIFGREFTKYTGIYGAYTVFLAGKFAMYMYVYKYGVYTVLLAWKPPYICTVIYGEYLYIYIYIYIYTVSIYIR